MARGYVNKFELYPGAIRSHFVGPTGVVAKHAERVGRDAVVRAKILAPKRTGHLAKSITYGRRPNPAGYTYVITMQAGAHYAPFVLMGTHSPITPFAGRWLRLPSTRMGGGKFIYRQYVRGQAANNFLARAMAQALGAYGIALLV